MPVPIEPQPVELVRSIKVECGKDKMAVHFGKEIPRDQALIRLRTIFEALFA